ncbi:hypothetical protein IGI04_026920, partial [Brassica rapa subsp. trilocularis]
MYNDNNAPRVSKHMPTQQRRKIWRESFGGIAVGFRIQKAVVSGIRRPISDGKAKASREICVNGVIDRSVVSGETITPEWILCRLSQKNKYKDEDTRLRLCLFLLVEGILYPTNGSTQINMHINCIYVSFRGGSINFEHFKFTSCI